MGGCTSKKREAAAKQKQLSKLTKKKKKSRSKVYSASMDSIKDEADRVTGIPQRKTPYSRGAGSTAQSTLFGFRRRTVAPNTDIQQSQAPVVQPPPSHVMASTGRCSPHFPPTPPVVVHHQNPQTVTTQNPPSALPRPLTNRFGFQLSPRCTKVLNNINAQLIHTTRVDPNCNPLSLQTDSDSNGSIEAVNVTTTASVNKPKMVEMIEKETKITMPKIIKPAEARQPSRLPGPKVQVKPAKPARSKPALAKPVVAKPVVRPSLNKSIKTEVNEMVARQSLEEACNSGYKPQQQAEPISAIAKQTSNTISKTSLELAATLCKKYEQSPPKSLAPTAKPEDLEDLELDGNEHKVLLDEDIQEKLLEAWPDTLADDKSSSSYSEGIEEQHIEFPDNLTDKSADSLVSSVSSDSEVQPRKDVEKKKKSSGSLSQLSDGSSEQRDFLIDDEIADQPGLTFMAEEEAGEQYGGEEQYEEEEEEDPQTCAPEDHTDVACSFNGDTKYYTAEESQLVDPSSTLTQDLPQSIQGVGEEGGMEEKATPLNSQSKSNLSRRHRLHSASTGTLSPCESLTSDDLMLDFEDSANPSRPAQSSAHREFKGLAEATFIKEWFSNTSLNKMHENLSSINEQKGNETYSVDGLQTTTNSWFTDYFTNNTLVHSCEDVTADMEKALKDIFSPGTLAQLNEDRNPDQCYQVARQAWEARNLHPKQGSVSSIDSSPRPAPQYRSRTSSSSDVTSSPRGRTSRTSPLRPPRSSTGSVLDLDETGIRLDWNIFQGMNQDVLALKTNLLRLRRLLQDAEVTNPFDSSLQSSMYYNLASCENVEKNEDGEESTTLCEENADLRRQVVFLQQQMMEKDRTIHLLQQQMSKYCTAPPQVQPLPAATTETNGVDGLTACAPTASQVSTNNVATQTERVRPLSTGAALSQSYPNEGGPLVSSSKTHRRSSLATSTRLSTGSPMKLIINNHTVTNHSSKKCK